VLIPGFGSGILGGGERSFAPSTRGVLQVVRKYWCANKLMANEKLAQRLKVFGPKYGGKRKGNVHLIKPFATPGYAVSSHSRANKHYSLVDRGANGSIQGDDMRVVDIARPERHIDVTGVHDHETPKLRVGTAAGVATSQRGGVVLVSHQYALHGRGKATHSSSQLEHHKDFVDDRPLKLGGAQSLTTNDGRTSPLDSQGGPPLSDSGPVRTKDGTCSQPSS